MGVDQGTTGTTVLLLDEDWNLAASSHKEHKQYYPQPGWVEHDPKEILAQIKEAAEEVMEKAHVTAEQVECMGIDNQGETVVVWDKVTGEPLYPAIVWQDRRTATWIEELEEDIQYIESDPGRVRAKAYDIVLNGNEIGGGSVRIFQDDIQEMMFKALGFTKEQAYSQFGFLLDAFKYGVPPHAGLAYGLDRLVMLMAKQDSIRDVIAFPKIKDASCLMTEAPTPVDQAQLDELGLALENIEE
mgnify:CR=1 FL=1